MSTLCRSVHQLLRRLTLRQKYVQSLPSARTIHTSAPQARDLKTYDEEKKLLKKIIYLFDDIAQEKKADKASFKYAVDMYLAKQEVYKRGHVQFVYTALKHMKKFKAASDLDLYKKLLEVFPEKRLIPQSGWQVEMMHFPRQQECAIDIMEQMEENGVIPDQEFGDKLLRIFGHRAHAFRKYRRMMYWMPKFKNANPYPVPKDLPDDGLLLAMLALKRMAVDRENFLSVWKSDDVETEALEDTYIVSAQSPRQQELLKMHPVDTPLFVEGGYTVWLRSKSQMYFTLRADPKTEMVAKSTTEEDEDLGNWKVYDSEEQTSLKLDGSVHEQDDGTVLGMCITSTSTKDSLVMWVRYLQQSNPRLVDIPVVFTLRTPESEIQVVDDKEKKDKSVVQTQ